MLSSYKRTNPCKQKKNYLRQKIAAAPVRGIFRDVHATLTATYHKATLGLGHGFEDECAGEPGARSDDGDDDLSYLSSDDAASLADSALA